MVEILEGTESQVEEQELTPEEGAEITPPKEEPTLKIEETEEFRKALDEALGKGLASTNRQLSLQKSEAEKAKAEAEEARAEMESLKTDLQQLQEEQERLAQERFADDPEARKAYVDRQAIAKAKSEVAKAKAEAERKFYEAEKLAWSVRMSKRADELHKEFGISINDLEPCQTEEEMEVKALRFHLSKPKEETKEPEKKPLFDSHTSTGTGGKIPREKQQKMPDDEWFAAQKAGKIE